MNYGKIPLLDCTLVEDATSEIFFLDDDSTSLDSNMSAGSQTSGISVPVPTGVITGQGGPGGNSLLPSSADDTGRGRGSVDYGGLDFRLIVDTHSGPPVTINLVASTLQEKAAWCSDIGQSVEDAHYTELLTRQMVDKPNSNPGPGLARSDPKLFRDDVDIKFSRTLNSCKVPQIRHASVTRLLDRLTDLRFLSIDFLNTFLLTYRVFTSGDEVLTSLARVYRQPEFGNLDSSGGNTGNNASNTHEVLHRHSFDHQVLRGNRGGTASNTPPCNSKFLSKPQVDRLRRTSTGSMKTEVTDEKSPINEKPLQQAFMKYERQNSAEKVNFNHPAVHNMLNLPKTRLAPIASCETLSETNDGFQMEDEETDSSPESALPLTQSVLSNNGIHNASCLHTRRTRTTIRFNIDPGESSTDPDEVILPVPSPSIAQQHLSTMSFDEHQLLHSSASSETLTGSYGSMLQNSTQSSSADTLVSSSPSTSPHGSPGVGSRRLPHKMGFRNKKFNAPPLKIPVNSQMDALSLSPATSPKHKHVSSPLRRAAPAYSNTAATRTPSPVLKSSAQRSPGSSPKLKHAPPSPISYSYSSPNIINTLINRTGKRGSADSEASSGFSPRSSFVSNAEGSPPQAKAGTVVTSSRASKRRSSSTAAAAAFAAATAGSINTKDHPKGSNELKPANLNKKRESVISTAATMRVLNVLRHWVSKHSQDFEYDPALKGGVQNLLEEMVCNTTLLPAEHKAAANILLVLTKDDPESKPQVNLTDLLKPPESPSSYYFDTISALDMAEQLTYLDHQIFKSIRSEELLSQAWMKAGKEEKAAHVLLVSKRFNEVSCLVVSEIVSRTTSQDRVACIEKWTAIADICRCIHNYNGVLQICAAFVNSSVYRLKKTWEKVPKQTKQMIEKLQTLVSSDGRFRNMRDALHRCDPPCIPYLGMYLTDLSFIEEGTPNYMEETLVNFSKMRMVAHVIREIQLFQQTVYRIEHQRRVTNYLLDGSRLLTDEHTYKSSLEIEPRHPRVSMTPSNDKA